MASNLIALLDAYEAARATSDKLWVDAPKSDAAVAAYEAAMAAEECAVDAAIFELKRMQPGLNYNEARGLVAIPAYRAKLRATIQGSTHASA